MLIAHAASTCDVCLEGYQEDCSYHSIPCGHVFCLPCLVSTSPPRCPLCRHDFTAHSVRKVHLTLPSARDIAARRLELKLVQSSPEMTLAESLMLFQEVQEWLEGEAQDEFLVLRAFAAVMCGFHETKDKLLQTEVRAQKNEALLLRSLEEARNTTNAEGIDYKAKYHTIKSEVAALRVECADLRAQTEQAHHRTTEILAHYAQVQGQTQSESESQPSARRVSNPLPAPPRPIEIPFLKLFETPPLPHSQGNKGKAKDIVSMNETDTDVDPMTSAFVPTLASITTQNVSSSTDVRSEVTTLVFKPPKRMPMWDSPNTSYARIDVPGRVLHSKYSDSSSRPDSYADDDHQTEHSRTNERSKVANPYAPSGLNLVPPERVTSLPASKVDDTGHVSHATGLFSGDVRLQPQGPSSENKDRQGSNPRSALTAPARPVSYAPPPRASSHAAREIPPSPFLSSMLPSSSRPREPRLVERGDISGISLRRASSPVVMLSDTDNVTSTHPNVSSYGDWRYPNRHVVPVRATARNAVGNGSSDMNADAQHRERRASLSPTDPRRQEESVRRQENDMRWPMMQIEHISSRGRDGVKFPWLPDTIEVHPRHGETRVHRRHDAPMSHGHSSSPASHARHGARGPTSPIPVRDRAHSHSHAQAFSLNHHYGGDMSPIGRRIPLDLSIAGPGATFPIMDPSGLRAVPVAEV